MQLIFAGKMTSNQGEGFLIEMDFFRVARRVRVYPSGFSANKV
jgi:hypothetical protein